MQSAPDLIAEFRSLAQAYVSLLEDEEAFRLKRVFASLAELLPRLYVAALHLPDVEPENSDVLPDPVTTPERLAVSRRLADAIGPSDHQHWQLVLGYDEPDERGGFLADDLIDIWGDLKEGLMQLDAGEPESEVVWEWRFGFWTHWGQHLVGALHTMHVLYGDGSHDATEYRGV